MTLSAQALTTVGRMQRVDGFARLDPTMLEELIEEASAEFAAAAQRPLHYDSARVERVRGFGTGFIYLTRAVPIVSITSIEHVSGATSTTLDASTYAVEDADLGVIRSVNGNWAWTADAGTDITGDPIAGTERRAYVVTYSGGYVTPQQAADDAELTRNLPRDIERAVIEYVKTLYFGQARDQSLASRSTPRGSQSMAFNTLIGADPGLPLGFMRVAKRYRLSEV